MLLSPHCLQVCERTESDKKGGHLAQDKDGNLLLRESAQCPKEDEGAFQVCAFSVPLFPVCVCMCVGNLSQPPAPVWTNTMSIQDFLRPLLSFLF